MTLYCLVQNNQIVEGPRTLPVNYGNISRFDLIADPKPYGWYPLVEGVPPSYDSDTHIAVSSLLIAGDTVVRNWSVRRMTDAEWEASHPVPPSVTPAQAQIVLFEDGLLDTVTALCENHPYVPLRIWWRNANVWERGNPYLNAMALELNLTEKQVDDMFRRAARK